jgi:hypothetical protein
MRKNLGLHDDMFTLLLRLGIVSVLFLMLKIMVVGMLFRKISDVQPDVKYLDPAYP